jgi:hypothetical protein
VVISPQILRFETSCCSGRFITSSYSRNKLGVASGVKRPLRTACRRTKVVPLRLRKAAVRTDVSRMTGRERPIGCHARGVLVRLHGELGASACRPSRLYSGPSEPSLSPAGRVSAKVTILRAGALPRATGVPGQRPRHSLSPLAAQDTTSPRASRTRAEARAAAGGRLPAIPDPRGPAAGDRARHRRSDGSGACHELLRLRCEHERCCVLRTDA